MSTRIFRSIDKKGKGKVYLEDYLIYNDIVSHGTQNEKNNFTFGTIDVAKRGRVNFEEFREFWLLFIELCQQLLNLPFPKDLDEELRYFFNQIS